MEEYSKSDLKINRKDTDKHEDLQRVWGSWKNTQQTLKNSQRYTVKTGYKYTRECINYAGLKVSGEELNTYENWKRMEVMLT